MKFFAVVTILGVSTLAVPTNHNGKCSPYQQPDGRRPLKGASPTNAIPPWYDQPSRHYPPTKGQPPSYRTTPGVHDGAPDRDDGKSYPPPPIGNSPGRGNPPSYGPPSYQPPSYGKPPGDGNESSKTSIYTVTQISSGIPAPTSLPSSSAASTGSTSRSSTEGTSLSYTSSTSTSPGNTPSSTTATSGGTSMSSSASSTGSAPTSSSASSTGSTPTSSSASSTGSAPTSSSASSTGSTPTSSSASSSSGSSTSPASPTSTPPDNSPGYQPCPAGLYSNPSCCEVDVIGLVDLDCTTPSTSPSSASNFQSICSTAGRQAKCCVLNAANQCILSITPIGI